VERRTQGLLTKLRPLFDPVRAALATPSIVRSPSRGRPILAAADESFVGAVGADHSSAYSDSRKSDILPTGGRRDHVIAGPVRADGASNLFELAVAVAISRSASHFRWQHLPPWGCADRSFLSCCRWYGMSTVQRAGNENGACRCSRKNGRKEHWHNPAVMSAVLRISAVPGLNPADVTGAIMARSLAAIACAWGLAAGHEGDNFKPMNRRHSFLSKPSFVEVRSNMAISSERAGLAGLHNNLGWAMKLCKNNVQVWAMIAIAVTFTGGSRQHSGPGSRVCWMRCSRAVRPAQRERLQRSQASRKPVAPKPLPGSWPRATQIQPELWFRLICDKIAMPVVTAAKLTIWGSRRWELIPFAEARPALAVFVGAGACRKKMRTQAGCRVLFRASRLRLGRRDCNQRIAPVR